MASRQPLIDDLEKLLLTAAEAWVGGRTMEADQIRATQVACQILAVLTNLDLADQAEALNAHLIALRKHYGVK